jgi:radical SAM protein with 4Fe4S-binding SPASM domain
MTVIEHPLTFATAPFVARREYFGCLVYDRRRRDYIPFDQDALHIFRRSIEVSLDELHRELAEKVTRQSFDTFVQLCASIDLMKEGRFQGVFLGNEVADRTLHLSAPTRLFLQLTRYCNLACRHCWADAGTARPRELTILEVRSLLEQMAEMGTYKLQLGGGEPLGRGDVFEILEHANSQGISVGISTNATMATRAVAQRLGELDVESFKVSMEAGSEKSYDYIRNDRAYRKAIRGIRNLKEFCPKADLYFHAVLQRDNLTEIPALIKQAEKMEVGRIVFDVAVPVGRARENSRILLSQEEAFHALDLARRIGASSRVEVEVMGQVPPLVRKKRVFEGFGCECGQLHCHVSSEGVVAASGFVSSTLPAGNVRETPLREIWNSGHGLKLLRSNPGNNTCKNCEHFRSCRGGCRSRTYATLSALTEPDPLCRIAREAR